MINSYIKNHVIIVKIFFLYPYKDFIAILMAFFLIFIFKFDLYKNIIIWHFHAF